MPDFPSYTLEELEERARAHHRIRTPAADVAYGSDYDMRSRALARIAFGFQKTAENALRIMNPLKSFGAFLREHAANAAVGANLQESVTTAQASRGMVIIRSTTTGQLLTAGHVLRHADGTEYTLDSNVTTASTPAIVCGDRCTRRSIRQGSTSGTFATTTGGVLKFDPTGEYCAVLAYQNGGDSAYHTVELHNDLDADPEIGDTFSAVFGALGMVTCSSLGKVGNKDQKNTLTIVSPTGTISATAYVVYLEGGRDELSPAEMREGIRALYADRYGGVTLEKIRDIAMDYPRTKLREVFVCPGMRGFGAYTLYPIGEGVPFVPQAIADDVAAYVAARISPVDKVSGETVTETVEEDMIIEARVSPVFEPDWLMSDGNTAAYSTVSTGSTTMRVGITGVGSDGIIQVGHRVIVSNRKSSAPKAPYIVHRKVTAVGTNYIDVDEPLPYPVGSNGVVSPGGALAQSVIDAVYSFYENQSPFLQTSLNTWYRYPVPTITSSREGFAKRISDIDGVLDVAIKGDLFSPSTGREVLVPGKITIKMWV